jgi:DNA-binding NarL/FixJ family response regulator
MRSVHLLVFDDDLVHRPEFLAPSLAGLSTRLSGEVAFLSRYRPHADFALSDLRSLAPDMVLMDFHMGPHADGVTAVRAIRAHHPAERLPILAISSEARMNRAMLAAGACEACVKMALPESLPHLLPPLLGLSAGVRS